ncbi:hypothetical protein BVC80_8549g7 [Macleaya cordata]|uniref:Uncharacterized protein n=1 Tax=Macleaya cordata TaxID=56857 RepID=A0A200QQ60_MACCD|nr:hypothetical protein BVC80_8549g7 [Macleaya cordata]
MKFLDWYLKIAVVGATIGASMELFMIKTGLIPTRIGGLIFLVPADDKVTVLESEKRAWESSPEAQAVKEALNPWRNQHEKAKENP